MLSEPDEERLWLVIAVLFGMSALLLFASLAQPWYVASFYSGSSEINGVYEFEEWEYQLCSNDSCQDPRSANYDRAPAWEGLMSTSRTLVGLGVVGIVGFGILLGMYYFGHIEETRWIKAAWGVGFVATLAGITYFALQAGDAARRQLVELVEARGYSGFEAPEAKFWGSQQHANGVLETAPGVGWLLAILALATMVPPTILLYQFPERADAPEEDYALDDDESSGQSGHRVEV